MSRVLTARHLPAGSKITYQGKPGAVMRNLGDTHLFDYVIRYIDGKRTLEKEVLESEIQRISAKEFFKVK